MDLITTFIWLILALLVAWRSFKLDLGQLTDPGPGFLPFCASLALGILAAVLLGSQLSRKGKEKIDPFRFGPQWRKAVYFITGSFLYGFVFWEILGYLISTTILLVFLLRYVGSQGLKRSLIISLATTLISYLVFQSWLQCMLPKGLLKGFHF